MSPTPVTFTPPDGPASYSWEATDEEVSARYGIPPEQVVRFDLNTSPAPPAMVARLLEAGRFETPLSEYPPSDYRRLVEAAAARYGVGTDELVVGAGADEILDIIGKVYLPAGGAAVIPVPSYAMYRVITEQRGARAVAVPRQGPDAGYAMDVDAVRAAVADAQVVWLCNPNNPTALPEPEGAIADLLGGIAADAAAAGRSPAMVVLDEAYAEFVDRSLVDLRLRFGNLIVVRTASKAYALAGLRVGFAVARPDVVARLNPVRPPGSVSTVSVTIVTEALLDPTIAAANVARVERERERLRAGLAGIGWRPGPSVTNFVLVDFGSVERAAAAAEGLLRRGLVPRTFPATHPLADHLRLTVRADGEDDRLIAAARDIDLPPEETT
ncbi:MAG: histidinol-phosphate transaminase [Chloroflexota bacterium]